MSDKQLLSKTGVAGIASIENQVIISLVTGDPLMLMGNPGSAKTMFATNVAKLLGFSDHNFVDYSVPMITPDDIIGAPVPEKLSEDGKWTLGFAQTPASIWDKEFVFFDEINRGRTIDTQNLMLKIISERSALGIDLPISYVWGAQNYLIDKGTKPLDAALADRFAIIVPFPEWHNLSSKDKLDVMSSESKQDARLIESDKSIQRDDELIKFLVEARKQYTQNSFGANKFAVVLVDKLIETNPKQFGLLGGRRAKMISRNVRALLTIMKMKDPVGFNIKSEKVRLALEKTVAYSMPHPLKSIEAFDVEVVKRAVGFAKEELIDQNDPLYEYISEHDWNEMIAKAFVKCNDKDIMSQVFDHCFNTMEKAINEAENNSKNAPVDAESIKNDKVLKLVPAIIAMSVPDRIKHDTLARAIDICGDPPDYYYSKIDQRGKPDSFMYGIYWDLVDKGEKKKASARLSSDDHAKISFSTDDFSDKFSEDFTVELNKNNFFRIFINNAICQALDMSPAITSDKDERITPFIKTVLGGFRGFKANVEKFQKEVS